MQVQLREMQGRLAAQRAEAAQVTGVLHDLATILSSLSAVDTDASANVGKMLELGQRRAALEGAEQGWHLARVLRREEELADTFSPFLLRATFSVWKRVAAERRRVPPPLPSASGTFLSLL